MRWLGANWIWLVVVGGMLWMHLGMHRGHGGHGHGGQSHRGHDVSTAPQEQGSPTAQGSHDQHGSEPTTANGSHRHRGC